MVWKFSKERTRFVFAHFPQDPSWWGERIDVYGGQEGLDLRLSGTHTLIGKASVDMLRLQANQEATLKKRVPRKTVICNSFQLLPGTEGAGRAVRQGTCLLLFRLVLSSITNPMSYSGKVRLGSPLTIPSPQPISCTPWSR